jgi:phasin family protein
VFDRNSNVRAVMKDVSMNSLRTAGFPFANTEMTKAWINFRVPSRNIEALLEAHRNTAAALTSANRVVFDGLKTLLQRQGDLFKTTVDDYSKVTSEVLAGASFAERATKQADSAGDIYLSTVARFRELSDIAVKANVTAVDILNARVTAAFDEFRMLFAAPVTPTPATSVAPTSVIAGPVSVAKEVAPTGDSVAQVEPEPTTTAAPTKARKTTARKTKAPKTNARKRAESAAKAARRRTSRR